MTDETAKEKKKEWMRQWRINNREHINKKKMEYHYLHRDEILARRKKHREENKELIKKQDKDWRDKNKEALSKKHRELYAENPQLYIERTREWTKKNPKKRRANAMKHYSLKKNARGRFSDADITKLLVEQDGLCTYCRCDISQTYTIDHITPLSRGGSNWPDNIQLLCHSCNCSKNNKTHEEYIKLLNT